jgi:hypothetical protein
MRKVVIWTIVVLLAVAVLSLTFYSTVQVTLLPAQQPSAIEKVPKLTTGFEWGLGTFIAFLVLLSVVTAIITDIIRTEKTWKKRLSHAVFIAIGILIVVNAAIRISAFPWWIWLTEGRIFLLSLFFLSLNLLIILMIFLFTKEKEESGKMVADKTIRKGGWVILALIFTMVIFRVYGKDIQTSLAKQKVVDDNREKVVAILGDDHPLLVISECVNPEFRHYERGKEAQYKVVMTREDRVGVFRIPEELKETALKDLQLAIYKFDDNVEFAKKSWEQKGGLLWFDTVDCWGPKLKKFEVILNIPGDDEWTPVIYWSKNLPLRTDMDIFPDKTVRMFFGYSNGSEWDITYDPDVAIPVNKPQEIGNAQLRSMKFRSPSGKPVRLRLVITVP